MDWTRGGIDHDLRVVLVDPRNLTTIRGELEGIDPSGSLMLDYYSDIRMKANISTSVPEGKSDVAYRIPMFPFLDVMLQYWDSDDEFPASLQLFVDDKTIDFMHYETAWFALSHLLERIKELMA